MAIPLDEAKNLHQSKGAVFMDARPQEEFTKGHIQGAISLPWHEAEKRVMDVTVDLSNDAAIVTYCDGDTCDLSKDLALFLENLGFSNALVLPWLELILGVLLLSSSSGNKRRCKLPINHDTALAGVIGASKKPVHITTVPDRTGGCVKTL